MLKNRYKKVLSTVVLILLTFIVSLFFTIYWFDSDFRAWDDFSEAYSLGRIYQMQIGHENIAGFLIASSGENTSEELFLNELPFESTSLYVHQIGLQGTALGLLNQALCLLSLQPLLRLQILHFVVI